MTLKEALSRPTIPVPDAGRLFFNLGRNSSYLAAKRGEIPTVNVGGRVLAIVAPLAQKVGLQTTIGRAE